MGLRLWGRLCCRRRRPGGVSESEGRGGRGEVLWQCESVEEADMRNDHMEG